MTLPEMWDAFRVVVALICMLFFASLLWGWVWEGRGPGRRAKARPAPPLVRPEPGEAEWSMILLDWQGRTAGRQTWAAHESGPGAQFSCPVSLTTSDVTAYLFRRKTLIMTGYHQGPVLSAGDVLTVTLPGGFTVG